MPVRTTECTYQILRSELEATAKFLAGPLDLTITAPDKGTVELDHGIFLTIAENLIGNAARFAKSKLTIRLEQQESLLLISITDNGPGYPPKLIQDGPKPFGKLTEDTAHFGMGLYSSQILCQKHGGTLTLTNEKGCGATVIASFKVQPPR